MKLKDYIPRSFGILPIWETDTRALKNYLARGIRNNFEMMEELAQTYGWEEEFKAIWMRPESEWPDEFKQYHDYEKEVQRRAEIQEQRAEVRAQTKKLIRAGILRTENSCKKCGETPTEIHHFPMEDGTYVADKIVWLCRGCHKATHQHLKTFYHPCHGLFLEKKPPLTDEYCRSLFGSVFGEEKPGEPQLVQQ